MSGNTVRLALLAAMLGMGSGLVACNKPDSPGGNVVDSVKDGLDLRENEPIKDAAEDVRDGVKDAAEAVEEKAEEVKEDMK